MVDFTKVFSGNRGPAGIYLRDLRPMIRKSRAVASCCGGRTKTIQMDADFIRDLFAAFGPVTVRRMFSGAGIFADGLMFGLIVRDVIYLKADAASVADFEREGSTPFTYTRGKKSGRPSEHALPYWRLPERLYDDADELAVWAKRAFAAAERKKFAPRAKTNTKRSKSSRRGRA